MLLTRKLKILITAIIACTGYARSQCPTPTFVNSSTNLPLSNSSPVKCSDSLNLRTLRTTFFTVPGELPEGSGYVAPGFWVVFSNLDANSYLENTIEFFENGVLLSKLAPTVGVTTYNITGQMLRTDRTYSFRWCDAAKTGIFNYSVYDDATLTLITSGVFNHTATGKQCFDVTLGKIKGSAIYSGPGVTNYNNGKGSFNASKAGPGIHTITYCWNNGIGCNKCTSQTIEVIGPTADAGADKSICEKESVTIGGNPTGSGGAGSFIYRWQPSTGLSSVFASNPVASPAVTTTYTLTVTDFNGKGCTATDKIVVNVKPLPIITVKPDNPEICIGSSIILNATGADTYKWSPTEGLSSDVINNPVASPTATQTYKVTGTTNGCSSTLTLILKVNPLPEVNFSVTDANCSKADGAVNSTVTNGTSPYYYKWNTTPAETSADINNVKAGSYILTVTDSKGCIKTDTAIVNNLEGPVAGIVNITDETCSGSNGSAEISATGGKPPYSYTWNTSPPQNSAQMINVSAGTYIATVTDKSGCTASDTVIIKNFPPPQLKLISKTNETCGMSNGMVTVEASGGTGNYSYLWNTIPPQTTPSIASLKAGEYSATVTDEKGCSDTITITIATASSMVITISDIINETCSKSNGSATANVTGGTEPYSYLWNTTPQQTQMSITGLKAGVYILTVSDKNKCTAGDTLTITNTPPPALSFSKTDAHCNKPDGSAIVIINGNSPAYSVLWNTSPPNANDTISNITPGSYTVTVSDNICTVSSTVIIENIPGPDANFIYTPGIVYVSDGLCNFIDQTKGNIISWFWYLGNNVISNDRNTNYTFTETGKYAVSLTVTDNYGCRDSITRIIDVRDLLNCYIPNAFTPDNDGLNDEFGPEGINLIPENYEFYIFNRWGERIFFTDDYMKKWNGKIKGIIAPKGVYTYRIALKDYNRILYNYFGRVTLLK